MKKIVKNICIILCLFVACADFVYSNESQNSVDSINNIGEMNNFEKAESLIRKAQLAKNQEESYEYVHKARVIYEEEHELNPTNIKALLGLSKVNQMLEDRANAKLYVLKAYNMFPNDPFLQKEMGDFYYSFQEYSTAIEYYKLSLASGNLRNFETNLQAAKCFEKLGDIENATLYYKICNHLDSSSRRVMNKVNEYESLGRQDYLQEFEHAKYKYLFKDKPVAESTIIQEEAEEIIENINSYY